MAVCGEGQNGGDGFEVGRLLLRSRFADAVEALLVGDPEKLRGDARETHRRFVSDGGRVTRVQSERDLEPLRRATLVVDAMFGTGLTRPLEGLPAAAARLSSTCGAFVVAVDVPSGLDSALPEPIGPHVIANLTVTFGFPKTAHAEAPAAGFCGRIVVADIGVSFESGDSEPRAGTIAAVGARDLAPLFPPRPAFSHKGAFGTLAVVGGQLGMAGAPTLAARAALRSGVGKVVVVAPEDVRPLVHALSPESMTAPFEADLSAFDAAVFGPGLGTGHEAMARLDDWLNVPVSALFDADALNLAAGRPEVFVHRDAATVLTPHLGEAGRLLGRDVARIRAERTGTAEELASLTAAVVILKGFRSLVAAPDGRISVVLAGNPGMATAGAGDVLSGVVGSLLARGLNAYDAARAGAWLHGAAGDMAAEALGEEPVTAGDLVDFLPDAFALVRDSNRL